MKEVLRDVLEFFYPRICNGCGQPLFKGENTICLNCHIQLPRTEFHFSPGNAIEQIFWGRLPILHASSFLYYRKSGITQRLVHGLKYGGKPEIGRHLGYLYGQEVKEAFIKISPDIITTVPLHPQKLNARGFNQSDEIAKGFSEATGIPFVPDVLVRNKSTETQTKRKRYQRWENMENRFELNTEIDSLGKHIILMDDVITTGSTLEACGKVLLTCKDASLSLVSL